MGFKKNKKKMAVLMKITSSTTVTGLESLEVSLGFLDFNEDLGKG